MSRLKELKIRIKSVKSTKKITQAMKIVAASRLKQAQQNVINSEEFYQKFSYLLKTLHEDDKSIFNDYALTSVDKGIKEKILIIVFSSDRGLCGAFNAKLTKELLNTVDQYKKNKVGINIVGVGNKISVHLNLHYKDILEFSVPFTPNGTKMTAYKSILQFGNKIQTMFEKEKYTECRVIYTDFNSVINQKISNEKLLPIDTNKFIEEHDDNTNLKYDNSTEESLSYISRNFINAKLNNIFMNSLASEYSSRMLAMDNATKNSESMLKELNVLYNRNRQALITKELIEIISGAEAIN
ncbi:MAG: F-type H+-transporting ATPase subunit gamma [Candidatus Midichloriaceae bacterium]|jgi:F-type H+-transporting ATPase subunit gamma